MTVRDSASRLACALGLLACGAPPPPSSDAPAADVAVNVDGPIAATVDGEPIGLAEVEQTAQATGLTPIAALHRLEQERALLHRADRASLGADAEAERATRRAAVQALLRARVEDPVSEASVDDADVAARYEANRSAWARPERRASVHVLVAPRAAGDATAAAASGRFVREVVTRLAAAADPVAEANAIGAEGAEGRSFSVRVETIPAAPRHGALEEPFAAALFSLHAPGVVPAPVTTSFGMHAIVITSIEPPFEVPLAEAAPILRRQIVTERRATALDALTTELRAQSSVAVDERRAATVFTADLGSGTP